MAKKTKVKSEDNAKATQQNKKQDKTHLENDQKNELKEEIKEDIKEQKKVEKSEKEIIAELNDKYLRLAAEYDNYRKRTLKEKMDMAKSAGSDILLSLLPVVDDLERALGSIDNAKEISAVKEGVALIYNKFSDFLKQRGIKEINAKENDFDTDLHEAITKIPAPTEKLKGKVVDVVEKGYYLNDKVIRFSKVVVGE